MNNLERRHGPDLLSKVLGYISIAGWLLILIAAVLFFISQPEMDTGLVRYKGIEIRDDWLLGWLRAAYGFILLSAVSSIVAFVVHRKRSRRTSDQPSTLIIILAALSFIFVIVISKIFAN